MDSIKDKILKERGLAKATKRKPKGQRQSFDKFVRRPTITGISKTPLMKYLEEKYHLPIEDALVSGSLSTVARMFNNEVDVTTISRWIKRFNLRYTENNLPKCMDCPYHDGICDGGVCNILMKMELYELVLVKRKRILEGNYE